MGRAKQKEAYNNNLAVGIIFCLFILVLLIGSAGLKLFDLVRKSSFDGKHPTTIAISTESSKPDDRVHVISFNPDSHSISILLVPEIQKTPGGSRVVTANSVGKFLEVPLDGTIIVKAQDAAILSYSQEKVDELFQSVLFKYKSFSTNLTIIDMIRFWIFAKSVPPSSVKVVDLPDGQEESVTDKLTTSLFADSQLSSERFSIQVINGAEIGGYGNRLARFLTNGGANVIAVSTSSDPIKVSQIEYVGEESYTVDKLSRILKMKKVAVQKNGISDIIIKIGEDKADSSPF